MKAKKTKTTAAVLPYQVVRLQLVEVYAKTIRMRAKDIAAGIIIPPVVPDSPEEVCRKWTYSECMEEYHRQNPNVTHLLAEVDSRKIWLASWDGPK